MTVDEMKVLVKSNMKITDATKDLVISDTIQETLNYCNLPEPVAELEPFIRKKVQTIINYELENGTTSVFDRKVNQRGRYIHYL